MSKEVTEGMLATVREIVQDEKIRCAQAFRLASDLGVSPTVIGIAADELGVHLARCQLGLFGYDEQKRIIEAATEVSPELEQAILGGLILGRLPCAVAWIIAKRLGISKMHVSGAAEKLGVRLSQCQLGAF